MIVKQDALDYGNKICLKIFHNFRGPIISFAAFLILSNSIKCLTALQSARSNRLLNA